jgi:hypothetical protein
MTERTEPRSRRVDGGPGSTRNVRNDDLRRMKHALRLATRGRPAPNPHVGALVIQSGKAVGFGWLAPSRGQRASSTATGCFQFFCAIWILRRAQSTWRCFLSSMTPVGEELVRILAAKARASVVVRVILNVGKTNRADPFGTG